MCPILNLTRGSHDAFVIFCSLFAACLCMQVRASCIYILYVGIIYTKAGDVKAQQMAFLEVLVLLRSLLPGELI